MTSRSPWSKARATPAARSLVQALRGLGDGHDEAQVDEEFQWGRRPVGLSRVTARHGAPPGRRRARGFPGRTHGIQHWPPSAAPASGGRRDRRGSRAEADGRTPRRGRRRPFRAASGRSSHGGADRLGDFAGLRDGHGVRGASTSIAVAPACLAPKRLMALSAPATGTRDGFVRQAAAGEKTRRALSGPPGSGRSNTPGKAAEGRREAHHGRRSPAPEGAPHLRFPGRCVFRAAPARDATRRGAPRRG